MPNNRTEEKVQAIAQYIQEVLKEKKKVEEDQSVAFAEEINQQYDIIMKKKKYDFMQLESVRKLCKKSENYSELALNIQNECIEYKENGNSKIIYATDDFLKKKYAEYSLRLQELHQYATQKGIFIEEGNANTVQELEKLEKEDVEKSVETPTEESIEKPAEESINEVIDETPKSIKISLLDLERQLQELKREEERLKFEWEAIQKKNSEGV